MAGTETEVDPDYLDFYPGGVPPNGYFQIRVTELRDHAGNAPRPPDALDTVAEICLIGLVAYFEAFLRDQFASLVNIYPPLLNRLKAKDRDLSVDATALLKLKGSPTHSLGFLLAERYDFGSPPRVKTRDAPAAAYPER